MEEVVVVEREETATTRDEVAAEEEERAITCALVHQLSGASALRPSGYRVLPDAGGC